MSERTYWLYGPGEGLLDHDELISLPVGCAPFGAWLIGARNWVPNFRLAANPREQQAANLAGGYECHP